MTEEEINLFSEFLEERQYARADYRGLKPATKTNLLNARNNQAKRLKVVRKRNNLLGVDHDKALQRSKEKSKKLSHKAKMADGYHRLVDADFKFKKDTKINRILKDIKHDLVDSRFWK